MLCVSSPASSFTRMVAVVMVAASRHQSPSALGRSRPFHPHGKSSTYYSLTRPAILSSLSLSLSLSHSILTLCSSVCVCVRVYTLLMYNILHVLSTIYLYVLSEHPVASNPANEVYPSLVETDREASEIKRDNEGRKKPTEEAPSRKTSIRWLFLM